MEGSKFCKSGSHEPVLSLLMTRFLSYHHALDSSSPFCPLESLQQLDMA